MDIIGTKILTVRPVGHFNFSWTKKKGHVYIADINTKHETSLTLDKDTYEALRTEMIKANTDVLTDGKKFYTITGGDKITEIDHLTFRL